jgi:hypothetical protein
MPYDTDLEAEIKHNIWRKPLSEIKSNPSAMQIFRQLGSDQNIIDYGFNPIKDGQLNTNVTVYNDFINTVYNTLRIQYNPNASSESAAIEQPELMLSMTTFNRKDYGDAFIKSFAVRLGLDISAGLPDALNCLRSTIMSPFTSDIEVHQHKGSYWPVIMKLLAGTVSRLVTNI